MEAGKAGRESMRNGLGRLAGESAIVFDCSIALEQDVKADDSDHARSSSWLLRPTRNVINGPTELEFTHSIIRHHPNRHNPSLQCLGTLSKSLSFQSHLLSNLLLTFQQRWLRVRIDDCTTLSLHHPQHT
jgi:hypothetical protein